MAEEQKKMGRPKGSRDKKPRRTEGYQESNAKSLVEARKHSPITQAQKAIMPEGYNAKVTAFMMEIMPKEPLDLQDVAEMERRFLNYVQKCSEWDMKVGNQAAYMAIGITKEQAWEWENVVKGNPARSDFVKKVRQFCGVFREGLMQDGKVNPVTGIFWQKNYDGMKDQTEMVLTPNNPLGDMKDTKALEQKYLESAYNGLEVTEGTFTEIVESPEGAEGQKE